jgi:acetyl esterase/lipase
VLSREAAGPDVVVRYAAHSDGVIDVFLPPNPAEPEQPAPLVVLLHGGFWRQEFDRRHLRPLAGALARHGQAVAVPEFRRVGGAGGWPETGADVEAALASVAALVRSAAPGRVAASPYALVGHSAGGHLALWAGLRAGPSRVARIVALAPVADLEAGARTQIGENAVVHLLGGAPEERPGRYAEADALRLLPGDVPVTIVHGTEDRQVPVGMSRAVATRFPELTYVELDGVEHFGLINPLAPPFPVLRRLLGAEEPPPRS